MNKNIKATLILAVFIMAVVAFTGAIIAMCAYVHPLAPLMLIVIFVLVAFWRFIRKAID